MDVDCRWGIAERRGRLLGGRMVEWSREKMADESTTVIRRAWGMGAWAWGRLQPALLACLLADGKKYKRMSERIFEQRPRRRRHKPAVEPVLW